MTNYNLSVEEHKWDKFKELIPRNISINKQLNIMIDVFIEENR